MTKIRRPAPSPWTPSAFAKTADVRASQGEGAADEDIADPLGQDNRHEALAKLADDSRAETELRTTIVPLPSQAARGSEEGRGRVARVDAATGEARRRPRARWVPVTIWWEVGGQSVDSTMFSAFVVAAFDAARRAGKDQGPR